MRSRSRTSSSTASKVDRASGRDCWLRLSDLSFVFSMRRERRRSTSPLQSPRSGNCVRRHSRHFFRRRCRTCPLRHGSVDSVRPPRLRNPPPPCSTRSAGGRGRPSRSRRHPLACGEIAIRGKGRVLDRLPLLPEVGKALALYLRKDRGRSSSRRVFLRMWAPRIGLAGPGTVGHIVRAALARAGIRRTTRGAAHIFRHSLATGIIPSRRVHRGDLRGPPPCRPEHDRDLREGGLRGAA